MQWGTVGLMCSCSAFVMLLAGPLGTRFGLWPFMVGFAMLGISLLDGLVGASFSLLGILKAAQVRRAWSGLGLGLGVVSVPSLLILTAAGAPPIHDITTDTADPPVFVQATEARQGAANPSGYAGAVVAEQQRRSYPDIQPVTLDVPVAAAFDRALATARAMGWRLLGASPIDGRIEASDTTFWFGFQDDVVIRVRPAGAGALVDVRSASRADVVGDAGTHARRVRAFLAALKSAE